MADPTFQIRVEPGHTHPEKRGGRVGGGGVGKVGLKKKVFGPSVLSLAPPLDPPLIIIIAITILLLLIIMMMMI